MMMFGVVSVYVSGQPAGAGVGYNLSETKPTAPAGSLNTSGGSFTTVILSAETQNIRWKAYAGNVTGVLTLDDNGEYSIYQWTLQQYTGEVYASRASSIDWTSIACATPYNVSIEETAMNHTTTNADSINSTFNLKIHKTFFVGNTPINQNTCKSTFTWANDTAQTPDITAPFQEVLIHDGTSLIYTTCIDDGTQGFNYKNYDFQMIVAERGVGGYENTRYYFYLELGG